MADIARLCGVTVATVSRVLSNQEFFSTSATVRQKIKETARKLGYMPDLSARNLSLRNSRVIGLFASAYTHIGEGINEALVDGITETLHAAEYDVFYGLSRRRRTKTPVPSWRFDGAVLMQAPAPESVTELDLRRVPYVCVNERVGNPIAYVLADDALGMNLAIDHLTGLGHQRIAYANAPEHYFRHYSNEERLWTLMAAERAQKVRLIPDQGTTFHATLAARYLRTMIRERGATALITYDHQIAFTIMGAAAEMGLKIPQDFSLVCFNDMFPAAVISPALTCVAVPAREMGRLAAELLLKDLASPELLSGKEVRLPEKLVVRGTTGPPPPG
jgi:LacI family transcriptional regulator, galactose operon repressor